MLFKSSQIRNGAHRVVVTGAGIITALGAGWKANASGFRSGHQAFRKVSLFDVKEHRCRVAAEIDLPNPESATFLSRKQQRRLNRAAHMLLIAAKEAWEQSEWIAHDQTPIVLGTTSGEMTLGQNYLEQALSAPHRQRYQATRIKYYQGQRQGLDLCETLGFHGPITMICNACASGANAIGHGWDLVRSGRTARVVTGGYDALCRLTFAGFDSLQALSPTQCLPFAMNRDGLTLGEGAAVLALESLESALVRNAQILGEITGYGAATDVHHLTQPHPNGNGALAAMKEACEKAQICPEQVDYVNAHGTATPQNDSTEAQAINRWAGDHARKLWVSSTKASVGHLLGASGAVEAVVSLMALQEQWLPPQTNIHQVDPVCRFNIVRKPSDQKVNIILSNSFGFGGANASLVFRRWS